MKFLIVFVALVAVALADDVRILKSDSDVQPDRYSYNLETSDGTSKQEAGQLEHAGSENEAISVKGSYTWVDPEGHSHTTNYVANEYGFQPEGADIPVAPVV